MSFGCQDGRLRVVPDAPEASYLVHKLVGGPLCSGSEMPPAAKLAEADIERVVGWICAGAPR
jgi:hypothetical protein